MFLILAFIAFAYGRGGCNIIENDRNDENAIFTIQSSECMLSGIKENFNGLQHLDINIVDSRFVVDTSFDLSQDSYGIFVIIKNSTLVIDYSVRFESIQFIVGKITINKDLYVNSIALNNDPTSLLPNITCSSNKALYVGNMYYVSQYSLLYNIPENLRIYGMDSNQFISTLQVCEESQQFTLDHDCGRDIKVYADYTKTNNYIIYQKEAQCPSCPECHCSECEECPQCNYDDYVRVSELEERCQSYCPQYQQCEQCQQCQECEQCPKCECEQQQCQDCRDYCNDNIQDICRYSDVCPTYCNSEHTATEITITLSESLVYRYSDISNDKRGIVELEDGECVFTFEATGLYSNDGYDNCWYYIKGNNFYILPRYLIKDVVVMQSLSLSRQLDLSSITYKSTSNGFYIVYDDDTFDVMVKSPYDFLNSYTLNEDGTFTYMFTTIYSKVYAVGDSYNGKVITKII